MYPSVESLQPQEQENYWKPNVSKQHVEQTPHPEFKECFVDDKDKDKGEEYKKSTSSYSLLTKRQNMLTKDKTRKSQNK